MSLTSYRAAPPCNKFDFLPGLKHEQKLEECGMKCGSESCVKGFL